MTFKAAAMSPDIPFSERDIQNFIWSQRETWASLIDAPTLPPAFEFATDLGDVTPARVLFNRLRRRMADIDERLRRLKLVGCEVPLSRDRASTIRADFLGAWLGDHGLAIVELKKSDQTEREAFTELLAYAHHLGDVFPTLSKEDVTYVLISPMVTRIAQDALIHSLVFDERPAVALTPYLAKPGDLLSLRLKPWFPDLDRIRTLAATAFDPRNFDVVKVVWEASPGWWNGEDGQLGADQREWLNQVSGLTAQLMEAQGIHGFTYAMQSWPEVRLPLPNALVLVGFNPYAIAHGRLALAAGAPADELPPPSLDLYRLPDVLPGLRKSAEALHSETNYLGDLRLTWDSTLRRLGRDVVERSTTRTTGKPVWIDTGALDWSQYHVQLMEDALCENLLMRPTGLLRQLYQDVVALDYLVAGKVGVENHPVHGDMFFFAIEALNGNMAFRQFLDRMLGDDA
jgi:hypothetical protein